MVKGFKRSVGADTLPGNQFIRCLHSATEVGAAAREFADLLERCEDSGLAEKALLEWLGVSTERICVLAYAEGAVMPTHVARELILGDMRADFALLAVPEFAGAAPRLLLVECQGALPTTLFKRGPRAWHYWGSDFLDGFSQLMDWHFSEHHLQANQKVATLTKDCTQPLQTYFLLVAGLRRFASDTLSVRRLKWWAKNMSLGSNFDIKRFDDVAIECGERAQWMGAAIIKQSDIVYPDLIWELNDDHEAACV